jgi:hypothetical protein
MNDLADHLVGRTILAVTLDDLEDGLAVITLDDGSRLEIRTSKVGDLMLKRDD